MLRQVERPGIERSAAAELDDADPAQVERPHPEPLERQVEECQQQDLDHAVVADDQHRPWAGAVGIASLATWGRSRVPATPAVGEAAEDTSASAGRSRAATVGDRLAARRPGLERPPPPRREDVAPATLDLVAVEALPLALADLEEARLRPRRDRPPERQPRRPSPGRSPRPSASCATSGEWTISTRRAVRAPAGHGERVRAGEALGDALGLAQPDRRQRRLDLALEAGPRR